MRLHSKDSKPKEYVIVVANELSKRQQRLMVFMMGRSITMKSQHVFFSPFFYTQVSKLHRAKLVSKSLIHDAKHHTYKLTRKGKILAQMLVDLGVEGGID